MILEQLVGAGASGMFKEPEYNSTTGAYNICGSALTGAELEKLMQSVGWSEHFLPTLEIMKITDKYAKAFNKYLSDKCGKYDIHFQNFRGNEYGTTYNRVVIDDNYNGRTITVIDGMKSAGGKYVVYLNGAHISKNKFSSLKGLAEFIETW